MFSWFLAVYLFYNAEGETGTLPLACTLYKSVPPVSVLSMYVSSCMYVRKLPVIAFELDTWNLVHIIPVDLGKKILLFRISNF